MLCLSCQKPMADDEQIEEHLKLNKDCVITPEYFKISYKKKIRREWLPQNVVDKYGTFRKRKELKKKVNPNQLLPGSIIYMGGNI